MIPPALEDTNINHYQPQCCAERHQGTVSLRETVLDYIGNLKKKRHRRIYSLDLCIVVFGLNFKSSMSNCVLTVCECIHILCICVQDV